MMRRSQSGLRNEGFTVAEMLVALMITGIVFAAVGTLAFAVGNAQKSTENMSESQIKLRYATLRIAECIRHARLALSIPTNGIAVWTADDNDDTRINGSELVYIESYASGGAEQLRMLEFPDQSQAVTIADITNGTARTTLINATEERSTILLDTCSNIAFTHSTAAFVNLTFSLAEGSTTTTYQISARVNGSADNLIDAGGELTGGDDD